MSQLSTHKEERREVGLGIGLGMGLVASGLLCLLVVPSYLGATLGWVSFWHLVGAVLGLGGVAGALIELDRIEATEGGGYIGAGLALSIPAGVLHLLQADGVVRGGWASGFRVVAVVILLVSTTGIWMGIGKLIESLTIRPASGGAGSLFTRSLALLTAIVGMITAILNFLAP